MASPVAAQLILCDAAVAEPNGKIHMLGAGWSLTPTPTAPSAVAVLIKVPWDRANQKLHMTLQMLDSDGQPVSIAGPAGEVHAIRNEADLEVGRPAGVLPGSPIDASLALTVPPLPLAPGRYEWRLDIAEEVVTASFQVRAP